MKLSAFESLVTRLIKPADKILKNTDTAMKLTTHKAMRAHDQMLLITYVNMQCSNDISMGKWT